MLRQKQQPSLDEQFGVKKKNNHVDEKECEKIKNNWNEENLQIFLAVKLF